MTVISPKKAVILSDRRESKDLRLPLSLLLLLRLPLPSIRISVIRSEPRGPQRQVFVVGVGTGPRTFFSSGAPADRSSSVGWSSGVVSRRTCIFSSFCQDFRDNPLNNPSPANHFVAIVEDRRLAGGD